LENSLTIFLSPKKLRIYRKTSDKRQYQIADILGVDRTTYVGYEKLPELEVPIETAKKVAEFLGVSMADLQKVENDQPKVDGMDRHLVKNGDYISVHQSAWAEFQMTLKHGRDTLSEVVKTNGEIAKSNSELTQNNTELTKSITEIVKNLLSQSGSNQKI
jgi:DNA-binding XRE family transcriptional regulator